MRGHVRLCRRRCCAPHAGKARPGSCFSARTSRRSTPCGPLAAATCCALRHRPRQRPSWISNDIARREKSGTQTGRQTNPGAVSSLARGRATRPPSRVALPQPPSPHPPGRALAGSLPSGRLRSRSQGGEGQRGQGDTRRPHRSRQRPKRKKKPSPAKWHPNQVERRRPNRDRPRLKKFPFGHPEQEYSRDRHHRDPGKMDIHSARCANSSPPTPAPPQTPPRHKAPARTPRFAEQVEEGKGDRYRPRQRPPPQRRTTIATTAGRNPPR